MDIKDQFNTVADEYDRNRKKFIPCFEDFYINTTDLIASNIAEPKQIIDLGAGTGLLTYFWYQNFPNSQYMLIDIADEMLSVAQRRFHGIENISYMTADYVDSLPDNGFDAAISALSIHHLENDDKIKLFSKIYEKLPDGGLFVNYDQFCADQPEINRWFDNYWESQWLKSDLTRKDIELAMERKKLDKECSAEREIGMLSDSGFKTVKCVYSNYKFSVIAAIK